MNNNGRHHRLFHSTTSWKRNILNFFHSIKSAKLLQNFNTFPMKLDKVLVLISSLYFNKLLHLYSPNYNFPIQFIFRVNLTLNTITRPNRALLFQCWISILLYDIDFYYCYMQCCFTILNFNIVATLKVNIEAILIVCYSILLQ